jgi:hypothetical protein
VSSCSKHLRNSAKTTDLYGIVQYVYDQIIHLPTVAVRGTFGYTHVNGARIVWFEGGWAMAQTDAGTTTERAMRLNCFTGQTAPPLVLEGWRQLAAFPAASREPFWLLLAQVLMQPGSPTNPNLVAMLCKQFTIEPQAMLAAIGCCESLFKQAAALDLSEAQFRQDLEALGGAPYDLIQFIQARFPEAKQVLRRQILMDSLAAHGKVMTNLEWRLDQVMHSSKGNHLSTEIVLLTLHYQEGRNQGTVTLQLTREAAQMLRRFCERLPNET